MDGSVSVAGEALRGRAGGVEGLDGPASRAWVRPLLWFCALVLIAAALEIVIDASLGRSVLIPRSPTLARWLQGIGERLGFRVFLIALLSWTGAYGVMLALARRASVARIQPRLAILLVVVLQLIIFVGPILLSTDVFSYIAYARMGVEHGINPYLYGPRSIRTDPVYTYVGGDWRRTPTAYGPLYTLLSYPAGLVGLVVALWYMKGLALLASFATLALVWRCARARGLDQVFALLVVGANPLYVIYCLGGAHNDLIMMLMMMVAVSLMLVEPRGERREAWAGAAVMVGAFIKITAGAMLPFMILSRRRLAPIVGALLATLLAALVGYLAFGIHGLNIVGAPGRDAALVSTDSFATEIAHLFGKPGVFPVDHEFLSATFVLIIGYLLWRTWRGYDWIAASGWALLAIAVTSTWLLPWYIVWSLPLAVLTRDRRLLLATLAIELLFVIHQTAPLLAPVS